VRLVALALVRLDSLAFERSDDDIFQGDCLPWKEYIYMCVCLCVCVRVSVFLRQFIWIFILS
jgi:hypothetical protein